jgi:hypothetical protein
MKIFELAKNENGNSNIFPQTGLSRFWILAFKNFWDPMEKRHFFQKKAKKSKFQNSVRIEKKIFRKKVLLRSSYIHKENQCSKNLPNRRWSLVAWSILIKNRSQDV